MGVFFALFPYMSLNEDELIAFSFSFLLFTDVTYMHILFDILILYYTKSVSYVITIFLLSIIFTGCIIFCHRKCYDLFQEAPKDC